MHEKQLTAELEDLKAKLKEIEEKENVQNESKKMKAEFADGLLAIQGDSVKPNLEATQVQSLKTGGDYNGTALRVEVLHLQKLLSFLDTEFAPTKQKFEELLSGKSITYDLLWCLFRLDNVISFKDPESGLTMAGQVNRLRAN